MSSAVERANKSAFKIKRPSIIARALAVVAIVNVIIVAPDKMNHYTDSGMDHTGAGNSRPEIGEGRESLY